MSYRINVSDEIGRAIERLADESGVKPRRLAVTALIYGLGHNGAASAAVETQTAEELETDETGPLGWEAIGAYIPNHPEYGCRWPGCGEPVGSDGAVYITTPHGKSPRCMVHAHHISREQLTELLAKNIAAGYPSGFRTVRAGV